MLYRNKKALYRGPIKRAPSIQRMPGSNPEACSLRPESCLARSLSDVNLPRSDNKNPRLLPGKVGAEGLEPPNLTDVNRAL